MRLSCVIIAALLAGPALAEPPYEDIKIEAGAALFEGECRQCHAPDSDHASYGPPLVGIVGRPAGSIADYEYSDALRDAAFVWTPGAIRAWMEDNDGFLPGTKMRHVGVEDPTVQDFILTYLASISPDYAPAE